MGLFDLFKRRKTTNTPSRNTNSNAGNSEANMALEVENMVRRNNLPVEDFSVDIKGGIATVYGQTASSSDKSAVLLAVGNMNGVLGVDDRISVVATESNRQESRSTAPPVYSGGSGGSSSGSRTYTVQSGDSLSKIAKNFYGDPMKYMTIFEANTHILKDPNLIHPGQELIIP